MDFPGLEYKIELLKRGITQRQLAKHFGVHFSLISLIINNYREPAIRDRMLRMLQDMRAGKFHRLEDY